MNGLNAQQRISLMLGDALIQKEILQDQVVKLSADLEEARKPQPQPDKPNDPQP